MNYDDYAIHILQKYRLAVTIAVIKTKPENISLEDHIEALRSKLNSDEMDFEDLNISINSDDFKFDETLDLLDNVNENSDEIHRNGNFVNKISGNVQNDNKNDGQNEINISENDFDDILMNDTQDLNESITILDNFQQPNNEFNISNSETGQRRSLIEIMDILKGIDDSNIVNVDQASSRIELPKLAQEKDAFSHVTDEDLTQCHDVEATLCESMDRNKQNVTSKDKYTLKSDGRDLHTSKEKLKIIKDQNAIHKENPKVNVNKTSLNHKNIKWNNQNTNVSEPARNIQEDKFNSMQPTTRTNAVKNYRHTKEYNNIYQNVANIFDNYNKNESDIDYVNRREPVSTILSDDGINDIKNVDNSDNSKNLPTSSKDANYSDLTQEFTYNTHYSESQVYEIHIDAKHIQGIKRSYIKNDVSKTETNICKKRKDEIIILQNEIIKSKEGEVTVKQTDENEDHNEHAQTNPNLSTPKTIGNSMNETDIFSQDITEVLIPSSNAQRFDENNEGFSLNNNTLNKNLSLKTTENVVIENEEENITNVKNIHPKIKHKNTEENDRNFANADNEKLESQLFVTNSQAIIPTTTKNNIYEDSLGFPQRNIKNAIYRNIDDRKCTENRKVCSDFDNNIENKESNLIPNEDRDLQNTNEGCFRFDDDIQDIEETSSDSDTEKVPFKIIEELNKVKIYLNRRNEKSQSSIDTGYRSDPSAKTSLKLSQSSTSWLDQSAHSLYSYITTCPLIAATRDIIREISIILGQLIDKLHEEEKYPTFLEEMLNSIQTMLGLVYEDNNQLKTKDEYIHRIILFNRSIHIQKYTIEKITQTLENLYTELTAKNSDFEIKNIEKLENVCHIFHLLEMLLKKYRKYNLSKKTENLIQNTQSLTQGSQKMSQNSQSLIHNSQEYDKLLKKSNIMDIWRKKWNPNFKEVQNEGSQEKVCEIGKCCAVLNKLIVDCFEGYSLVSYFALQCFNVMQN